MGVYKILHLSIPISDFYGFVEIAFSRFRGFDVWRFPYPPVKFTVVFNVAIFGPSRPIVNLYGNSYFYFSLNFF